MTLVELVLVMVVSGILFVATPPLMFHGVQTMVFLPRAVAVNEAGTEAMHQIVEGGFSTLPGQSAPVRGLRFAVRRSTAEGALWLAEASRIGFRTSEGQNVLVRVDADLAKRSLPASATCPPTIGTEEILPYQAAGVRILPATALFRYYNQSNVEVPPAVPPVCLSAATLATIRRVDVAFTAQTGSGVFDEGQARQDLATAAAIRVP